MNARIQEQLAGIVAMPDSVEKVNALNNIALPYRAHDPTKARAIARTAMAMAETLGYVKGIAEAHLTLGDIDRFARYGDAAFNSYRIALSHFEVLGDLAGQARVINAIGICNKNMGRFDEAKEWYAKAMELNRQSGNLTWLSINLANLGVVAEAEKDWHAALDYYKKAQEIVEELLSDDPDNHNLKGRVATNLHNIGTVLLHMEAFQDAIPFLMDGIAIREERKEADGLASGHINLAGAYRGLGDFKLAAQHIETGLQYARICDALHWTNEGLHIASCIYEAENDLSRALAYSRQQTATLKELNLREKNAALAEMLAQYDVERKEKEAELHRVRSVELQDALESLKVEKARADDLLHNILPRQTIKELKANRKVTPRQYEAVTVLFTDFEGFTQLTERISPEELISQLNVCFTAFDRIVEKHGLEKIKTIGDSYMAASGVPLSSPTHAQECVRAALEMIHCMRVIGGNTFRIRIGIHTGPVVAGIVGVKKFQYDIWGDTVNTASRMESSGEVGKVNISEATYALVKDDFACEYRGEVEAKGKGKMGMWFVHHPKQ